MADITVSGRFKMKTGIQKALFVFLMAFAANGLLAAERFNKPIVETFRQPHPTNELYYAGVDEDGDGFADLFIIVNYANRGGLSGRLAGLLREGTTLSYDDRNKRFDSYNGFFYINYDDLLEINGRSVRSLVAPEDRTFPFEAARQARIQQGGQ
jgi:hypothetical protein